MGYCGKVNSIPARSGTVLLANIVKLAALKTFVFTESIMMSFEVVYAPPQRALREMSEIDGVNGVKKCISW